MYSSCRYDVLLNSIFYLSSLCSEAQKPFCSVGHVILFIFPVIITILSDPMVSLPPFIPYMQFQVHSPSVPGFDGLSSLNQVGKTLTHGLQKSEEL